MDECLTLKVTRRWRSAAVNAVPDGDSFPKHPANIRQAPL